MKNTEKHPEYIISATKDFSEATNKSQLDSAKAMYIGPKSHIYTEFKKLSTLTGQPRADLGRQLNNYKNVLDQLYRSALDRISGGSDFEPIDMSQPTSYKSIANFGHKHPTSQILSDSYDIFTGLGFAIVDSDEIETDWYNFEALNMPETHPAREMQDTFYIEGSKINLVPRTHTSGTQIRFMENNKPPFKIVVPGRVFRNEDEDATHIWSFYQLEGLVVGEGVSVADLKGTLLRVVRGLLGPEADIRFRASYFPYTEPSVELDCKYQGKWLELGGAGMVHPQVLLNGGIDPNVYTGFAFGWGVERLANIKYGLTDLRELWRPRFSFMEQF
ncbi:MAG: phenylalanine--tRNA ligase subunit alpha [Patescibacteria group bacterium]|nr:phenylalanine--tRNA ligase subunit alpha [Patescibacteria group bacterium]